MLHTHLHYNIEADNIKMDLQEVGGGC